MLDVHDAEPKGCGGELHMTAREPGSLPFVFVLMPFGQDFRDVYDCAIKIACADARVHCERVDEQRFDGMILQRVCDQILTADVIIAEMTGRNPNVFYEVGYAHALRKRVILLTADAKDIPFDLRQHRHIVYEASLSRLKAELTKEIMWSIAEPPEDEKRSSRTTVRRITRILAQLSKTVAGRLDVQPLLESILEEITEILEAEVCSIFLKDAINSEIIHCVAASGFARPIVGIAKYQLGEGFTGEVFKRGHTAVIASRDGMKQFQERNAFQGKYDSIQWAAYGGRSQFRNGIATPLKIGDETIGVIKVENKAAGNFSVDDVSILEAIANGVLAVSFQNARLLSRGAMQA